MLLFTLNWVERKNPLDYLSLFLSFSVKFSQTCQGITKHRAVFFHWLLLSPRPWHAVNSKPYCQEQQPLCSFSFSFSRLHKHVMSYVLHGCEVLYECLTVNAHAVNGRKKNHLNSFYQTILSNQTSLTWKWFDLPDLSNRVPFLTFSRPTVMLASYPARLSVKHSVMWITASPFWERTSVKSLEELNEPMLWHCSCWGMWSVLNSNFQ